MLKGEEWKQRLKMQQIVVPGVTILMVLWPIFVVFDGTRVLGYHPSVLVALLGSATASIVGLLIKVVSYVLPEMKR